MKRVVFAKAAGGLEAVGGQSNWETTPRARRFTLFADLSQQITCDQIARDYTTFYKRFVAPRIKPVADLSIAESKVLISMGSFARPMTGREIAASLRAQPSSTSRAVGTLSALGLARGEACPDDSRATCNVLTAAGAELYDTVMGRWAAEVAKAEFVTGRVLDQQTFATWFGTLNGIKDRAHTYARYRPGRIGRYAEGMSRPAPVDRHSAQKAFPLRDSYLRFFAEMASRDYLSCLRRRAVKPTVAGLGIGARELRIAMCLDFHSLPMSQSEIAEILRMDTATTTRGMQALLAAGLISQREDRQDARVSLAMLTDAGRDMASAYRERCAALRDRVDFHFGFYSQPEEAAQRLNVLKAISARARAFAELRALPADDLPT